MATVLEILAATMIVSSSVFVVSRGVGAVAYAQSLPARNHPMKLVEIPIAPTDKMFQGRPIANAGQRQEIDASART